VRSKEWGVKGVRGVRRGCEEWEEWGVWVWEYTALFNWLLHLCWTVLGELWPHVMSEEWVADHWRDVEEVQRSKGAQSGCQTQSLQGAHLQDISHTWVRGSLYTYTYMYIYVCVC